MTDNEFDKNLFDKKIDKEKAVLIKASRGMRLEDVIED